MKVIISIIILSILSYQVNAQIEWQHCYGGSYDDECNAIRPTFDGGYILAGSAWSNDGDITGSHGPRDFWVVKITASGAIEWQKCYGGSSDEEAFDIQQTTDSGYVVAGYAYSNDGDVSGNHGGEDAWVIKISTTGTLQWQKCYGGSGNDYASSIIQTNTGGYIVACSTLSNDGDVTGNHGNGDIWMIKLNDTGSITSSKCYGSIGGESSTSIRQTYNGGYIVGGLSSSNGGDVTGHHGSTINNDIWVLKFSLADSLEWEKSLGGSNDEFGGYTIQVKDSGYLVGGNTMSSDGDVTGNSSHSLGSAGWVVKLSNYGVIEWDKCIQNIGGTGVNALLQSGDGGYIIAGCTSSYSAPEKAMVGKLSDTGHIDWIDTCGGSNYNIFNSIATVNDGTCIAAGYTNSNDGDVSGNHGFDDYWVVKFGWHSGVTDVINKNSIVISPNPTDYFVNITTPEIITGIVVTDVMGKVVFSGSYNTEKVRIDVSALAEGMYFVKINNTENSRFIKE